MRFTSLLAFLLLAFCAPLAWSQDFNAETVILVAKRELADRVYGNTLILARPIGEARHVGFIVNKPTTMTLGRLFPQHAPSQKVVDPVYLGGPVGAEVVFALVKDKASPGGRSLRLGPNLFVAFDSQIVDRIIEKQSQQARFFAGMVMWQPFELQEEVKRGLWFVAEPQAEVLLRKPTDSLWEELVTRAERRANAI
jgi:putative transcriptional regulator